MAGFLLFQTLLEHLHELLEPASQGWARVLPNYGWKENKLVIYERELTNG